MAGKKSTCPVCDELDDASMKSDKTLDCTGLFCPLPIAKTRMVMQKMMSGEVLEILADDPGFLKDLPAWCGLSGEEFVAVKQTGNVYKGYVRKK